MAAFLTFLGGTATLVVLIEILDSMRFFGFGSILIASPAGLAGFILYGGIPIMLYSCGISLFMSRVWAYKFALYTLPILSLFLFFNVATNIARDESEHFGATIPELLVTQTSVFAGVLFRFLLIIGPLVFYLRSPVVRDYFRIEPDHAV